ncbi:FAD/NAD(P)-binding protein [Nocardioides sp. YIM 152315]|uniref:FAD/NAD(P)-binding protein n=1 Tax=Nocardioides sp. YIM 152315 TaxID=3031760 RepID=UPI0023DA362A|nr:FAD/NAD(P)-binding protein [Nocardioides sp. YIM 152315]MDF1604863.1 FAD/NAD(P)-binding protein [Nocardioides sp. YIM 152315]
MAVLDRAQPDPAASRPAPAAARVAVVGGGASGVLTALQLLSTSDDSSLCVTVHEATGVLGRGVAYGTSDPRHLLNVRARHMSAFADVPSDLLDWARRAGRDPDPLGFLPRMEYAAYLQDTLADTADHRLTISAGRVDDLVPTDSGFELQARGRTSVADVVVLAYGNQRPQELPELAGLPGLIGNPWDLAAIRALPGDADVVIVGTGLTAIDTAITLLEDRPRRRAVMVSRSGLLPCAHIAQQSTAWVTDVPAGPLTADSVAALVRHQVEAARAHGVDWRNVVDGLRPQTQQIWRRLDVDERRRFLATYARDWEVRRHRMAPEVADRIDRYRRDGRLTLVPGGTGRVDVGAADAVVNCTGPLTDISRTDDPLLRALQARGLVAPDPLRLGLESTVSGEVIGADGRVVEGLYAVGPPRRGTLWESTAIPEIRAQAAEVARLVLAAALR